MLKNYLLSAIRNIAKNKFYSALNIIGLTIGLVTFILIFLYVRDEITYDRHHTNYERIFRIESSFRIGTKYDNFAVVPFPMAPALQLEFPEVENVVRFAGEDNLLVRIDDKEYYENRFYYTDSTVFDVFNHPLLAGSLDRCLAEPNTIVLTNSSAKKYFGHENPIGQILLVDNDMQFKVTAVVADVLENSHLKFDALMSVSTLAHRPGVEDFNSMEPDRFWNIGLYAYVLLNSNSNIESIFEKFPGFYEKYMKSLGDQLNASFDLKATRLDKVHLTSKLAADLPTGNIAYIKIFSIVASFILLLASINYMNMATARATKRAKEVGLRKVIGADRYQLIIQFISEALLLTFIAYLLSLLITSMLLDDFNTLSGKAFTFNGIATPDFLLLIFGISVIIGIISGSYPAFYLSSFSPLKVLKGHAGKSGKASHWLRRGLVVIQFFIAIVMIIATIVVSDQLDFLKNKDLGFDKNNAVVLEMPDSSFRKQAVAFKDHLLQNPSIVSACNSSGVPSRNRWIQVMLVEQENEMKEMAVILTQCDYDYPKTMGFKFVEGRDFDRNMGTDDTAAVIINQTAAKQFGWGEDAIGKKINYGMELDRSGGRIMKVIGVVKDYNFNSLHNKIEPIIMFISRQPRFLTTVRYKEGEKNQALEYIEQSWKEFGNKRPFDYKMLSEMQEESYGAEQRISTLFLIIASITLFIALLGLLGLSSFTAESRTREMGIRKVTGALTGDIMLLLFREFFWLILISFVFAVPVAIWQTTNWLESGFVYYTEIHWYSVVISGLAALIIGLATISFHVVKAASANPVESLKYE